MELHRRSNKLLLRIETSYLRLHHYELSTLIFHLLSDGTMVHMVMRNENVSYILNGEPLCCKTPLEFLHSIGPADVYEKLGRLCDQ